MTTSNSRRSGILLHPTSLPSRYGIGAFDEVAYRWVDFLASTKQQLWQVLPLGPTGYGDSPYQSFSTFAGNPYLISLPNLVEEGLLAQSELDASVQSAGFDPDSVFSIDYGALYRWKLPLLDRVAADFGHRSLPDQKAQFEQFCINFANENLQQLLAEMNSNDSQTKTARENMRRQWAGYGEPKWQRMSIE